MRNHYKEIPVHGMVLNWARLKSMLDRMMGSSMVAMVCSSSSMSMVLIVCSMVRPVITMVGTVMVTARTIGKYERGKEEEHE